MKKVTILRKFKCAYLLATAILMLAACMCYAQTGGTGAIDGTVKDATGGVVPGAQVTVTNTDTGEVRTVESTAAGTFIAPLLPPGTYKVDVTKAGFAPASYTNIRVVVTETQALNVSLQVGGTGQAVTVEANAEQLQTQNSTLGHVTGGDLVSGLPLVTRNFNQILALNTGVATELTDATSVGRGNTGIMSFAVQGATWSDNTFVIDGLAAIDHTANVMSGGVATPNPDTIAEFKVQTGLYDASSGRTAGADIQLVTKGGTNQYHGSLFEFLRNEQLNANGFFSNEAGQPRQELRQNQYGFTFGGPVVKDKFMMFGSYQRTQQKNGVNSSCSNTWREPPLTNNRSAAAIGALFAGQKGYAQGLASGVGPGVAADGSNIAPQALALLNLKLPNGQYVIPTPQLIQPNQTFANQGLSSVSEPCTFHENQYMANADYYVSPANKLTFRFFSSTSDQDLTFPGQKMAGSGVSGWDVLQPVNFYHASINDTATISPRLVNQLVLGYHRQSGGYWQQQPFKDLYSQIGANAPAYDEVNPVIAIVGSIGMGGNGQDMKLIGDSFVAQDSLFYTLGRHSLRFGGLVDHNRTALGSYYAYGGVEFQTWADFLLGLNAQQLGTAAAGVLTGSIYQTTELQGDLDRDWRIWTADAYAQDDFKVTPRLTVNLGVRFEHVGDPGDALGHAGNFFLANANPNPPATGTIQGYVVASNFVGTIPAGVTQLGSTTGWLGNHTNTWNPRVGFAWQLPHSDRFVLRGGAGVYHSQLTTQSIFNTTTEPPYAESVSLAGSSAGNATWAQPFPAAVQFPQFPPYSPTTSLSFSAMSPDLRPPNTYRFSMGLQARLPAAAVLEVTYIGARDLHLLEVPRVDQANLASPSDPIRGLTTNTVANVAQRVPYEGFAPASFSVENTDASAWYNALQATLSKSLSHGLQFQASYTWARFLGDAYGIYSGQANFSAVYGDQDNAKQRYGPDNYIRDQRFVLSAMYSLPGPKDLASLKGELLGGWKLATVTTVQSGQHMTPFYSNASNVYGITTDRAQLVVGCTGANLVTPGSVGTKLTNYFNKSCFTTPPVVGADGKALNFGNAGMGILAGPGQFNSDLSMSKEFPVRLFKENSHFEFRAEFFNVFNHANFSTPGTSYGSSSFGVITGTTAGPRVGQLALKLLF